MNKKSEFGIIGLAVMGENLALNIESKGYKLSVYNRTTSVVDQFVNGRGKGKNISGYGDLKEFVESLEAPKKIMLMIRAGKPVDDLIQQLLPMLSPGDIIIDGGNSNYIDTNRRQHYLQSKAIHYIGTGISGGEEGALTGPSIMPGGAKEAWPKVKDILQKIAAKAPDGTPCCDWVGSEGAGHFVKMVHNGIEYGDMQLIAEAYFLLKHIGKFSNKEIGAIFSKWNEEKLDSYLMEISSEIMKYENAEGEELIDKILDTAGQKGTGKWSVINSMELGVPLNLIASAVYERSLSAMRELRTQFAALYNKDRKAVQITDKEAFINEVQQSLYASKLISYTQGFQMMHEASINFNWKLNLGNIAKIWRGGCIIRSGFLGKIAQAYEENPQLINLLEAPFFKEEISSAIPSWKKTVANAVLSDIPTPAFSSALNYFYSLTSEHLSTNLIQAQRDYFGAHTFERIDRPRGEMYHENWTGHGGNTSSTKYNI